MHENCFQFFLWVSGHHKRNWSQFTYARFLGVNKVFYGRCKNCEYVEQLRRLWLFFQFNPSKMSDKHFAKSLTYRALSWIALLYFFLTSWIWNKFVFEKLFLYKHLFKWDNPLVLDPVIVQSFDFNYALFEAETSLRRTRDTFKTVNGPLRSALGDQKYRKTEM